MTEKKLKALLVEWQGRLRLRDWNVTLELVPFLGPFGRSQCDKYKNAVIQICSPESIHPDEFGCTDIEVTLVHELLHLMSSRLSVEIEPDTAQDDALEEMIELVAQSLVALKRSVLNVKPTNLKQKDSIQGSTAVAARASQQPALPNVPHRPSRKQLQTVSHPRRTYRR